MNKKFFYQLALPIFLLVNVFLQASHQWEPFANLNGGVGSIAFEKIVCDGNGNGAAIWYDAGTGQGGVSYRPANGLWEAPYYFSTNGNKNYVDITMDNLGNVTVFYTYNVTNNQLYTFYRPNGGTWGSSQFIYQTPSSTNQILGLSSSSSSLNTQAIVAWAETTNTVKSCYRSGTSWASSVQVAAGTVSPNLDPIVHMLPNGNAEIAMYINPGTADVYSSYTTTPGGAWLVTPQATSLGATIGAIAFDINSAGKAVILATTGAGPGLSFVTKSSIGGAWQGPNALLVNTPVVNPGVGLSDSDQIIGIWSDNGMITYGIGSVGATTLSTQVIEQGTSPVVDVSPAGYFLLGWIATGGNLKTWLGSGTTLEPSYIVLDSVTSSGLFWNVCVGDNYMGWAIWEDNNNVNADKTIDKLNNLLQVLGKKRLIYQKGLFP